MRGRDHSTPAATPRPGVRVLAFLFSAPVLWFAHLLTVYGLEIALCGEEPADVRGDPGTWIPLLVMALTLPALAALVLLIVSPRLAARLVRLRPDGSVQWRFLLEAARLLALLSAFGVGWAGMASVLVEACATLR